MTVDFSKPVAGYRARQKALTRSRTSDTQQFRGTHRRVFRRQLLFRWDGIQGVKNVESHLVAHRPQKVCNGVALAHGDFPPVAGAVPVGVRDLQRLVLYDLGGSNKDTE